MKKITTFAALAVLPALALTACDEPADEQAADTNSANPGTVVLENCSGESPVPLTKAEVKDGATASADGAKTIVLHFDGDITQGEVTAGANAIDGGLYQRSVALRDGEPVQSTLWMEQESRSEDIQPQPRPEDGTLELIVPAKWADHFSSVDGAWLTANDQTSECGA
ncbi:MULTISPECIES: hypothetical protein [Corynebacterium]|uniref:hypothetical protein n=1 Tax=Corynebacterium TaxID=1716 RepID=UPI00124DDF79|nr:MULTISPECIES: hypothetical protein [Corynebacterium]